MFTLGILSKLQVLALAIMVIAGAVGAGWTALKFHDRHILQANNAMWLQKLAQVTQDAKDEAAKQQNDVNAAASVERAKQQDAVSKATERAASTEKELAAIKANPVVFPAALTKELLASRASK